MKKMIPILLAGLLGCGSGSDTADAGKGAGGSAVSADRGPMGERDLNATGKDHSAGTSSSSAPTGQALDFDTFVKKLKSEDVTTKYDGLQGFWPLAAAAFQHGKVDAQGQAAVPVLVKVISDDWQSVRGVEPQLMSYLIALDSEDLTATRGILKAHEMDYVRSLLAFEIGKWVVHAQGKSLGISNDFKRLFPQLGPKEEAAVAALGDALKDSDASVRQKAAEVLGEIGPYAKSVETPLRDVMEKDESEMAKFAATQALFKILIPDSDSANK